MTPGDPKLIEIAALRDEVARLTEELRQVKEAFFGELPFLEREAPALRLTPTERRLLAALYRADRLLTRRALHIAVSGIEPESHEKTIDVLLSKLRRKLKPHSVDIENVWGEGFRMGASGRAIVSRWLGAANAEAA